MSWHSFGATNAPETCLWCGRKLRRKNFTTTERLDTRPKHCGAQYTEDIYGPRKTCQSKDLHQNGNGNWFCDVGHYCRPPNKIVKRVPVYKKRGDYGDGHFCGLRCAYYFAVALANGGRRLQPAG